MCSNPLLMATIFLHFPASARMGINIYRSEKNYFFEHLNYVKNQNKSYKLHFQGGEKFLNITVI